MNRSQRRSMARRLKSDGSFHDKFKQFAPMHEPIDHTKDLYCHNHKLMLDDISPQTDRDKRLIASVTYRTEKFEQKDGKIKVYKVCPRCTSMIFINTITRPLLKI